MQKTVQDVMTQNVIAVYPQDRVLDAANLMKNLNVGVVPVVENNKPVGIITDRDIVLRNTAAGGNTDEVVANIMSKNVVTISPSTDVHEAAKIMAEHQIRRLPVVDNDQIVGMVALGDLATEGIFENEAGRALSSISTPSMPASYGGAVDTRYTVLPGEDQGRVEV